MKRMSVFFLVMALMVTIFSVALPATVSYADDYGLVETYDPGAQKTEDDAINKYVGPLYNVLYTIAIVASVITISIIGLVFIVGSTQDKADYKKHLIPVAVGIFFVSFLTTIIGTLARIAGIF